MKVVTLGVVYHVIYGRHRHLWPKAKRTVVLKFRHALTALSVFSVRPSLRTWHGTRAELLTLSAKLAAAFFFRLSSLAAIPGELGHPYLRAEPACEKICRLQAHSQIDFRKLDFQIWYSAENEKHHRHRR